MIVGSPFTDEWLGLRVQKGDAKTLKLFTTASPGKILGQARRTDNEVAENSMTKGSPLSGRDPKDSERTTINVTDGTLIPARDEGGLLSAWNISFLGLSGFLSPCPHKPRSLSSHMSFVPTASSPPLRHPLLDLLSPLSSDSSRASGAFSQNKAINRVSTIYVEIIRALPLLVSSFLYLLRPRPLLKLQGPPAPSSPCRSAMVPTWPKSFAPESRPYRRARWRPRSRWECPGHRVRRIIIPRR